jgi:uncharacterized protein
MSDLKLIEAVKGGNLARIEELLAAGADVNQQDEHGWTPLNWAAGKGHVAALQSLLNRGADVFKVGRDQRTPYKIALAAGHVEIVKLLSEAEKRTGLGKSSQTECEYCKAYYLKDLRKFAGWRESKINWKENPDSDDTGTRDQEFSDDDVIFIHRDLTVTKSMWHNENVIFNEVTPEWEVFCRDALQFKAPSDLDIAVSLRADSAANSA